MHTVHEGGLAIRIPEQPEAGRGEAVFYNPAQELNRDLTVAVLRAFRERNGGETYLDATTASGVRGVRAAADGWDVTCLDIDPDAVALARSNFRSNDLHGRVRRRDANVELHRHRYDVVDIDPFGTPIPFADAGIKGTKRLLCVTATDTAPLCGAHFLAGVRRYGAVPRTTEYHAEMGVRILLSALARTAARYDVGIVPLLTHATRHYVRTYLETEPRATDANAAIERLGYLHHCEDCLHREAEFGFLSHPPLSCPSCHAEQVVTAGPLWLGPAHDREFVSAVRSQLSEEMGTVGQADALLATLEEEVQVPSHFDHHRLCKLWNRPAGPMDELLENLGAAGFEASRAHYDGTAFKTDADVSDIRAVISESSS